MRALSLLVMFGCLAVASAQAAEAPERLRVIAIGINDYSRDAKPGVVEFANLKYAARDAAAICDQFTRQGVPAERVTLLADVPDATIPSYANAVAAIKNLKCQPGDVLLFVFCGHGLNVGRDSYLCFPDTRLVGNPENDQLAIHNALAMSELTALLGEQANISKIIVTDACRNWANDEIAYIKYKSILRYDLSNHIRQLSQTNGSDSQMMIISSCLPRQMSLENDTRQHGLFTAQLLDALSGRADFEVSGNRDGRLSLYEAFQFAAHKTREFAEREHGARQHPFFEGAFTTDLELLTIPADKRDELAREYQLGAFRVKPLGQAEQIAIEKYAEGIEAFGYGDVQRTIELCGEVLEENSSHAEARRLRSVAYSLQGKFTQAMDEAKQLNSNLKVKYSQPQAISVGDLNNLRKSVLTIAAGDVIEFDNYNPAGPGYQVGQYLRVARVRNQQTNQWQDVAGWLPAVAMVPSSLQDQTQIIRRYQRESNQPITEGQDDGTLQQRLRANNQFYGSGSVRQLPAVERIDEINRTIDEINSIPGVGGRVPSLPSIPYAGGYF